jgi:hypothetical protein
MYKIVRGLYFMIFGESIPGSYRLTTSFPPEDLFEDQLRYRPFVVDEMGEVFRYRCNVYDEERNSLWWLGFYRTIYVPVLLESPSRQQIQSTDSGIILAQ